VVPLPYTRPEPEAVVVVLSAAPPAVEAVFCAEGLMEFAELAPSPSLTLPLLHERKEGEMQGRARSIPGRKADLCAGPLRAVYCCQAPAFTVDTPAGTASQPFLPTSLNITSQTLPYSSRRSTRRRRPPAPF